MMNEPATKQIDRDWLTAQVEAMIEDEDEIQPEENLMLYGLDSVNVMKLIALLEQQDIRISFEELATAPSINAWWALIEQRSKA